MRVILFTSIGHNFGVKATRSGVFSKKFMVSPLVYESFFVGRNFLPLALFCSHTLFSLEFTDLFICECSFAFVWVQRQCHPQKIMGECCTFRLVVFGVNACDSVLCACGIVCLFFIVVGWNVYCFFYTISISQWCSDRLLYTFLALVELLLNSLKNG